MGNNPALEKIEIKYGDKRYQFCIENDRWCTWEFWSEPMTSSGYDWTFCQTERVPMEIRAMKCNILELMRKIDRIS